VSARGIAIKRPTKPRGRRGNFEGVRIMAVAIDKCGIAHIAATKREAVKKAQEANATYK